MHVNELYASITARIIGGLEQGVKPWQRVGTRTFHSRCRATPSPEYRGSNVLWLWFVREQSGFSGHVWLTYRQAQELIAKQAEARGVTDAQGQPLGGVRRGAKAAHCVKYVVKEGEEEESSGLLGRGENPLTRVNHECLSITESNMRAEVFADLFSRVGVSSIWKQIGQQAQNADIF